MIKNKVISLIKNRKFKIIKKNLSPLDNNKLRVKIKTVGICASDIPRAYENGAYNYPLVMGHEISGEVFESKIKKFSYGDKVSIFPLRPCKKCLYCKKKNYNNCKNYSYYGSREDGGYAEFIDVDPWNIIKLPKKINFLDSFALEPCAVALNTIKKIFKKKPSKDDNILILGSGFIGLLISNILKIKYNNLNLSVLDRNDHKLRLAPNKFKKINIKKIDIKNFYNKFDYIIETTGNSSLISDTFNLAKNKSLIAFTGNINGKVIFSKNQINLLLRKELKIIGIWNSNYKNPAQNDWVDVIKLFEKGLKPSKLISHKIKIDKIPRYINQIFLSRNKKKKFKFLKIVATND